MAAAPYGDFEAKAVLVVLPGAVLDGVPCLASLISGEVETLEAADFDFAPLSVDEGAAMPLIAAGELLLKREGRKLLVRNGSPSQCRGKAPFAAATLL